MSKEPYRTEQTGNTVMERMRHAVRTPLGRLAVGAGGVLLAAGAALGVNKGVQAHLRADRLQAVATQSELRRIIKPEMVRLDRRLLAAHDTRLTPAGKGAVKVTDLRLGNENTPTFAVMGTYEDGKPNPNDPRYFQTVNVTPSNNTPDLGEARPYTLSTPKGEQYASQHGYIHGPRGEYYAGEKDEVDTSGTGLWYVDSEVATNVSASDGWGSTLDSGAPDTPPNRARQVISDLGLYGPDQY